MEWFIFFEILTELLLILNFSFINGIFEFSDYWEYIFRLCFKTRIILDFLWFLKCLIGLWFLQCLKTSFIQAFLSAACKKKALMIHYLG